MADLIQTLDEWLATEAEERFGPKGLLLVILAMIAVFVAALWWVLA